MLFIGLLLSIITYKVIFRYSIEAIKGLSVLIALSIFIKTERIFGPIIDRFVSISSGHSGPRGVSIVDVTYMLSPLLLIVIPIIVYKIAYLLLKPDKETGF
jgi:hypothetical protein